MTTRLMPEDASPSLPRRDIAVALVEDQRSIRDGLALLIDRSPGCRCIGAFGSMEDALARLAAPPDVALLDIGLPGMSGIDGARALKQRFPTVLVLMLTVYDDDERVFAAMCAGACGYLLKKTPPERLIESLRDVVDGGAPMSPEIARRVVTLFRQIRPPTRADYQLTPHETRLLGLLVDGHNSTTAAAHLGVSINTVGFHLRRIYEKLQVHSRSEAVAKALRTGLIR